MSRSPSFSVKSELSLKPDPESLKRWIHAFCIMRFDLEQGQLLEECYPPGYLSQEEEIEVSFNSFPDSVSQHHNRASINETMCRPIRSVLCSVGVGAVSSREAEGRANMSVGEKNSFSSVLGEDVPEDASSFGEDVPEETQRKERKKWTPSDDILLISSWLNTSKDPVTGNEQKSGAFWKRIAVYFAASPKSAGGEIREPMKCKNRWQKINDLVCKFCGSYEAAKREKCSGQNENDILKRAHEIFFNDYKKKFTLEHAWKELRNDQKWCDLSALKTDGSSKRRRFDDGSQSASSFGEATNTAEDCLGTKRPPGVKTSKNKGKKPSTSSSENFLEFERMWSMKEKDLAMKEKLSKMSLLQSIMAKNEPLSEIDEAIKKKLTKEIFDI